MNPDDTSVDESRPAAQVTLLDCTLRDGGYYNDWDFTPATINRYLRAIGAARVPIVEIGFRTLEADRYLGPTAFSTDRYLETLDLPEGVRIGVMVNAKEAVTGGDSAAVIDKLFTPKRSSSVSLVRFATHFRELDGLAAAVERLHGIGYDVGVNLMQIASRTPDEIAWFGKWCAELGVDVAYFADSFGGMQPKEIADVVAGIKDVFDGDIGCHTHDNMALAFANSLAAIDAGVTFADGTLLGMGRGPGNARTEYLAIELVRRGLSDVDPVPLMTTVAEDFAELHNEFGWGTNPYYFLSAAHGIHPTYIQEMTKDGRYSVDEVVAAVDDLAGAGGASFSRGRLEAAASTLGLEQAEGSWDATGWCADETVLIVGPGPNGVERRADIESYIRTKKPTVIVLNAVPQVDAALVDLVAICHPLRTLIDSDDIRSWEKPVVIPAGVWERATRGDPLSDGRDYGMTIEPGRFEVRPSSCTIPRVDAFPYALALAHIGGAAQVQLTGFDGFGPTNPRQHEMMEIFQLFAAVPGAPSVVALTRSNYPIAQSSIYSL